MEQQVIKIRQSKAVKRYRQESAAIRCYARGDVEARQFLVGRLIKGEEPINEKIPASVLKEMGC